VIYADRRTDMAKLIGAFSDYASTPSKFRITVVWDDTV
jgi:hypothetical protein